MKPKPLGSWDGKAEPTAEVAAAATKLRPIEEVAAPEEVTSATDVAAAAAVPAGTGMPEAKTVGMAIARTQTGGA
jgi:hypothetical protein